MIRPALLDTSFLIDLEREIVRERPGAALDFLETLGEAEIMAVSVHAVCELRTGAELGRRPAAAHEVLDQLLDGLLISYPDDRFAPAFARLAVLVPRPRVNLVLYYGVLAPRAAWRSAIVPNAGGDECRSTLAPESDGREAEVPPSARGYRWAELLRRTFDINVLSCPRCGGRLVLIALIEQPEVVARILGNLGLPSTLPRPAPARRAPRGADEWQDDVPVWTEPT